MLQARSAAADAGAEQDPRAALEVALADLAAQAGRVEELEGRCAGLEAMAVEARDEAEYASAR